MHTHTFVWVGMGVYNRMVLFCKFDLGHSVSDFSMCVCVCVCVCVFVCVCVGRRRRVTGGSVHNYMVYAAYS